VNIGRFRDALPPESPRPVLPPDTKAPRMWIVTRTETRTTRTVWLSNDPRLLVDGENEGGILLGALSDDVDVRVAPPVELVAAVDGVA
jgi:hypothetical protein